MNPVKMLGWHFHLVMSKIQTIQAVKGMNDILLDEAPLWEFFEDTAREVLRQYGYKNIRTPIVEPTPLFVRSIGEVTDIVEKEMYSFTDSLNGDRLTLRPEATAGILRAAIEHNFLYNGPQRVWTAGAMFRHERPQKGRYRQFHQLDVEALGFPGPDVDAEQIVMLSRLWKRLGLKDVALEINSIGDADERRVHREKLIAYFEQHADILDAEATRRLHSNPLRILDTKNPAMQAMVDGAPKLIDLLGEASRSHFEGLQILLKAAGLSWTVNPRLVRGMDYYNRSVFEWTTKALGSPLTICGGGRYDGLIEQLGGKSTPGVGFGLGIERVILLLQTLHQQAATTVTQPLDAYLVFAGTGAEAYANQLAESLRDQGKTVALHAGGGSFKSQMKKADSSGARYAIVVGEDEIAAQQATLKSLRNEAPQQKLPLDALASAIG